MKLEIEAGEGTEVFDDASALYPWISRVLPFDPQKEGLLQVIDVKRTDMAVYCRLPEMDLYNLREFVAVDGRGEVRMRLRIAEVPVELNVLLKMIFCGGKPVYRDDISEILAWARYFVFYNSKDPAVAVLWELEN